MDEADESAIARGLRAGEADAWRALYDAYAERVWCAVARRMGANSVDVADVVQETFLAAARSARSFDPTRGTLGWWLMGIARRHVALHYRKQNRYDRRRVAVDWLASGEGRILRALEAQEIAPPDVLAAAELADLVRATLADLPEEYEAVLSAKYLDGESVEHIADQQRSTPTAIRSKLARARQAFRHLLLRCSAFAADKGSP